MGKDKILEQLVAIVGEMQELCAVLRQNTVLTKTNGLLLKRHTARMNALLCEHGVEKLPDLIEENALLVEQNVIAVVRGAQNKQAPNKHRKLGKWKRAKAHFSLRIEFLPFLRVHGVYGV